ncbi:MAG: hypothetical protein QXP36_09005 [Conexivisphaerales archaeon]
MDVVETIRFDEYGTIDTIRGKIIVGSLCVNGIDIPLQLILQQFNIEQKEYLINTIRYEIDREGGC